MDGALVSLGRCIERADSAASVLEAHLQLLLEDPWTDEHVACRSMLEILQAPIPQRALSRHDVLAFVVDRAHPSSIASLLGAAREHANRSHDTVPADLWESLNATRSRTPRKVADDRVPAFISWVRERCALAVGIVDTAMRHDTEWHRFTLGRALARTDVTARLLASRPPGAWVTVLRASGAHQAYTRSNGTPPTAAGAIELMVLDELYPRSIVHSLAQAVHCLDKIGEEGAVRVTLEGLRTGFSGHTAQELLPRLTDSMSEVRAAISVAGS